MTRVSRFASSLRVSALIGVGALALSACGVGDLFAGDDWSFGDPGPTPTTAIRLPTPTPAPTNTPWVYTTPGPQPWGYQIPTVTATPSATPRPAPSPTPSPSPSPSVPLLTLLPAVDELPGDLELLREDADLTAGEVASEYGDAGQQLALLDEWEYRWGATREAALPNPGLAEYLSELLGFQSTVLEFADDDGAAQALAYQFDTAQSRLEFDVAPASIEQIGDEARALKGTTEMDGTEVRIAVVFVREDARVWRFVAISGNYDAFDDAVRVARETVD